MAIPALNPLWRTDPDDREQVRAYAEAPATGINMQRLTVALNMMAEASPAAVQQCQTWIDEVITLEADYADKISAGTAHLGNAEEFEGVLPGTTLTRDQMLEQADVVRWDTSLMKVRVRTGGGSGTEGAVVAGRISELKFRVLTAVGWDGVRGGARRSMKAGGTAAAPATRRSRSRLWYESKGKR